MLSLKKHMLTSFQPKLQVCESFDSTHFHAFKIAMDAL